ncbi:aldo/keto reductase [Azospirillum picis]|uniref:Aryl-alcohol dehydrogenase-like predicted oxidoreductase n=1 Tax=Azospirillum picis TaxID=488438 RepID=A0ABU0MG32_9PROT|nr:aldo/keto reductase [Azospirillum picis]MBP2298545.1 aryl-alcohol dehydrogenase-like predicted oxidoreductase [Azospirillum picis]MDQ0532406.1 aryl-alcohol dehydrogenase-like predicted oxidoreductase [Azospirillum picis]
MKSRSIGNILRVAEIGLGCMGMSEFYGPTDDSQSLQTLERALELGVTHYDTSDMYGAGHNETLLGRFLAGKRDRVTIATKFGIVRKPGDYARRIDTSAAYVREACEASLRRLGVDVIDLYYAHRLNPETPVEETVGAMADLVKAGKVRALGLSEVSAATLRRAHAVHPIAAVQSEYSLWTRDMEEAVLPACRDLGISLVAYAPLGRGMLTGAVASREQFAENDFRRMSPRFAEGNLDRNLALVEAVKALAARKGCTPGQIALAWLLAQGPDILPIPGTKRIKYLEENVAAAEVALTDEELKALADALPPGAAAGDRYTAEGMRGVNV